MSSYEKQYSRSFPATKALISFDKLFTECINLLFVARPTDLEDEENGVATDRK